MSADEGEEEPRWPPEGKAGRNKGRDLLASAINAVGVASLLAGLLQPALSFVQDGRSMGLVQIAGSIILVGIGGGLMLSVQLIAKRFED